MARAGTKAHWVTPAFADEAEHQVFLSQDHLRVATKNVAVWHCLDKGQVPKPLYSAVCCFWLTLRLLEFFECWFLITTQLLGVQLSGCKLLPWKPCHVSKLLVRLPSDISWAQTPGQWVDRISSSRFPVLTGSFLVCLGPSSCAGTLGYPALISSSNFPFWLVHSYFLGGPVVVQELWLSSPHPLFKFSSSDWFIPIFWGAQ